MPHSVYQTRTCHRKLNKKFNISVMVRQRSETQYKVMSEIRNVLFLIADQWRADSLGYRGHPLVKTPHLDALAADGVSFDRHYTQASPCGPSRASIHTGTYAFTHRSVRNGIPLDRRFTNWALEARRGGYAPTLFGYTDISADPRYETATSPWLRTYEGVLPGLDIGLRMPESNEPWLAYLSSLGYPDLPESDPELIHAYRRTDAEGTQDRGPYFPPAFFRPEHSDTAFLTDTVLAFLKGQTAQGPRPHLGRKPPWFAHVAYLRPHPPFVAPAPYHDLYQPEDAPAPVGGSNAPVRDHPWLAWHLTRPERKVPEDPRHLAQMRCTYYGLITEVDHHIGRIVASLKESGAYDETLIIFTSDHGEMLGDHGFQGKDGFFDPAFHVPLILKAPGFEGARGTAVGRFTEHVDVMPTLLDLLGLEPPAQCVGHSLRPFLKGDQEIAWREEAFWEYDFREVVTGEPERALGLTLDQCQCAALRGERYKYVHFTGLPPLLFDLKEDPDETVNLAERADYAEIRADMAGRMLTRRMVHADRHFTSTELTENGPVVRAVGRR